jgi:dihydropyrimidinase
LNRRLVIRGGQVVTPKGVRQADVVVEGERIVSVSRQASRDGASIDARGCYVLPGGIDPHTHLLTGISPATRSAAFGGTTSVLCFTSPRSNETAPDAVVRARAEAKGHSAIDVAFHAVVRNPDRLTTQHLDRLKALGVRGVKLFLAYPEQELMVSDGCLYRVLRESTRLRYTVRVHCENGSVVDALVDESVTRGRRGVRDFVRSRPPAVEEEAIARTLAIARLAGSPVYITHITTAAGMAQIRSARARGQTVHAEVCLHHLLLDERRYEGKQAERFLVVPPLRAPDDREALWSAIADGTVDTVATDHPQARYQPEPTDTGDFRSLPYGLPGIELRIPLVLSEGLRRKIPITRLAAVLGTRAAQIFGLFPRKGAVIPGGDADIVVWDPRPRSTVAASALHDGLGETPYEGTKVRGAVRCVLLRGRMLVSDGGWAGAPSAGRVLR